MSCQEKGVVSLLRMENPPNVNSFMGVIRFRDLRDSADDPVDVSLRGSMVRLRSPPNTNVSSV